MTNSQHALDANSSEEQVRPLLVELANHWQMPVLCLCEDGYSEEIEVCGPKGLYITNRSVPCLAKYGKVALVLDSPGGSIEVAYWILKALRRYVDILYVLVPDKAKSAATLLCLGANTVYIGPQGELGPLDVQKLDTTEGVAQRVSPLQSFKAFEYGIIHSINTMDEIVITLRNRTDWGIQDAVSKVPPILSGILSATIAPLLPADDSGKAWRGSKRPAGQRGVRQESYAAVGMF